MESKDLSTASIPLTYTELDGMLKRYHDNPAIQRVIREAIKRRLTSSAEGKEYGR